jgi:hypothetical protein
LGNNLWPYEDKSPELTDLLELVEEPMTWEARRRGKRSAYQEWENCFLCMCRMLDQIEDNEVPF